MTGLIKRDKWSIPYFCIPPKVTEEYVIAINDLFFNGITNFDTNEIKGAILLGNPMWIKQMANVAHELTQKYNIPVILSGGPSPAYKKLGFESVGCGAFEIIKGTFDPKVPESIRAMTVLNKMLSGKPIPNNIITEDQSANTYQNLEYSWEKLAVNRLQNTGPFAIYADSISLLRAAETFRTVLENSNVLNWKQIKLYTVPYAADRECGWQFDYILRGRIAAEVSRIVNYSNPVNPHVKKHIKLGADTMIKLSRVLSEMKRQEALRVRSLNKAFVQHKFHNHGDSCTSK